MNQETPQPGPGRPVKREERADAHIILRTTHARKGAWVASSRRRNQTLADWITDHCDRAAGYNGEPNQTAKGELSGGSGVPKSVPKPKA
jgi:hypothetical protein